MSSSVLFALTLAFYLPQSQPAIEFSGHSWRVRGEPVVVEEVLGATAVKLRNAALILDDTEFENGTIDFDFATTGHRSFAGAAFRVDEEGGSYEDFYLRPHNSGRFDALQYTPVFHGVSAWQLYPEYNASVEIPRDRWIHVRLVISGSRLETYVDGADQPTLVVENLRRGRSRGLVVLKSNFPARQPADLYPTAFANFRLAPEAGPATYREEKEPPVEAIARWSLSPAFPAPETPIRTVPAETLSSEGWMTAETEASGLLNLARHRAFPEGARRATVLARVVIESARPQVKRLNFGFSDEGSVFLNGQVLFSGNNTYLSRSQRYLGVVTVDNDAVYLPLRQGRNELVFAVTEAFGGWGLIARFEDVDGLRVEPEL